MSQGLTKPPFEKDPLLPDSDVKAPTVNAAKGYIAARTIGHFANVGEESTYTPTNDDVLRYNKELELWLPSREGESFAFSINSFVDNLSQPIYELGVGTFRSVGALTFSASYNNGPPNSASIQIVDSAIIDPWTAPLALNSPYTSGVSAEILPYPSGPGTVTFRLTAIKNDIPYTRDHSVTFLNRIYYGVLTKTSGFTETDIESLSSALDADYITDFTLTPETGEYMIFAYPTRMGTATFYHNGFQGGFVLATTTLSVTNASGYQENYTVYRAVNPGANIELTIQVR
jgi:hypothetical protein